jgi:Family of unknown function (DUF6920)
MGVQGDEQNSCALLARLRAFLMPGSEDAAQSVRCIRLKEKREMRPGPQARWTPFTAEERIDARQCGFVWEARFRTSRVIPMTVIDAYEQGHGRLIVKLGGAMPVVNFRGPECDKGELQRYLSGVSICPPMLIGNPALIWDAVSERTLRVSDANDGTGAIVEYEISPDGQPIAARADRPRTVGKKMITTPWSATGLEFREQEGMRFASHLEAAWLLPEESSTYFRAEVISIAVER